MPPQVVAVFSVKLAGGEGQADQMLRGRVPVEKPSACLHDGRGPEAQEHLELRPALGALADVLAHGSPHLGGELLLAQVFKRSPSDLVVHDLNPMPENWALGAQLAMIGYPSVPREPQRAPCRNTEHWRGTSPHYTDF